ncbi:MAG: Asp-tRNA(Asn)/Glu-tRNA(Gln) amidotransferase subunit GatC [Deltaproteobacteria bacterium]|jgi:aspartyl-tRNA(Asn)/glutamyl-tRNA(Gln) amidotransferase subunit C|nr:Asp-tRNA(Asn)/Glu-tRNA(Gln) amidotransferase subunit GatC [Deltaproteobacteria bacterium]
MPLDQKIALAMAGLARLELTLGLPETEEPLYLEKLTNEFSKIVGYMDILREVDTLGVEPLYSPMVEPQSPRPDIPRPEEETRQKAEAILQNAPNTQGRFFVVPRIV